MKHKDEISEICELYNNTEISQRKLVELTGLSKGTIFNLINEKVNYA